MIERTPDIQLDELRRALYEMHGVDVAVSTLSKTLKQRGWTWKKVFILQYML
jgi:transposase